MSRFLIYNCISFGHDIVNREERESKRERSFHIALTTSGSVFWSDVKTVVITYLKILY